MECAGNGRALHRAARAQPAVAARGGRHRRVDGHAARADPRRGGRSTRARSRSSSRASTAACRARSSTPTSAASRSPRRGATRCCSPTRSTASRCRRSTASRSACSCPAWYGMTHVKWLRSITAVDEPFRGWQQDVAYRLRQSEDEQGTPVTRMLPRALMAPPGIPDFLSRTRFVAAGPTRARGPRVVGDAAGRARRGEQPTAARRWADAELEPAASAFAWQGWRYEWDAGARRARALLPRDRHRRAAPSRPSPSGTTTASATTSSSACAPSSS